MTDQSNLLTPILTILLAILLAICLTMSLTSYLRKTMDQAQPPGEPLERLKASKRKTILSTMFLICYPPTATYPYQNFVNAAGNWSTNCHALGE
jgi:hypothetical protein